jgi:putative flippase GtrA
MFSLAYIPNFLIQNFVVLIFFNYLGWYKITAYALAAVIGVPLTFFLIKYFTFSKNTTDKSVSSKSATNKSSIN